jgi:hypothetical protein
MSNPLIQPNDPRFQRPSLTDAAGNNRFADDMANDESEAAKPLFASPEVSAEPSYRPEYASGQPSRQPTFMALAGLAWAALFGAALATWVGHWMAYLMLVAAVPSAAIGWHIAADELSGIRRGGVDVKHRRAARLGMLLNMAGVVLGLVITGIAVWQAMGQAE